MELQEIRAIKKALQQKLKNTPGVQGIGVGREHLRVYITDEHARELVPSDFQGLAVEIIASQELDPQPYAPPGS